MPTVLWRPEQPVRRVVAYSTDVITGHDGSEQRISRSQRARQLVVLRYLLDTMPKVREARTRLFRQMNSTWTVPTWWWPDRLNADVAASSMSWPFNDDGQSLLAAGDTFVVVRPDETYETFTVDSVTATEITSTAGAAAAFPKGSEILRLVACKLRDQPSVQRYRAGFEEVTIELDLPQEALPTASLTTFTPETGAGEALKILTPGTAADGTAIPLAGSPTQYSVEGMIERVDYGDTISSFSGADFSSFVEQRTYHANGRGGIARLDAFFDDAVGGRDPWYVPTYRADLLVDTQPSAPWTSFLVVDESETVADTFDYAGQWWTKAGYRQIRIKDTAGTELYRTVTSVTDNADGTITVNVLPALPTDTVIDEISFLEVVRLAIDAVRFEHTGYDATCSIVTKAVTSDDSAAV